jgi:hypothetical protein
VKGVHDPFLEQEDLSKPGVDEEEETTKKTRAALEKLITGKIALAQPVQVYFCTNNLLV